MRVVIDGRIVLPRMTGAGRYVVEIARRVPGLAPDWEVHVVLLPALACTAIPALLAEAGAQVHYRDVRVATARQWVEVPRVVAELRPDLYHYPFFDLPYVRCPSVVTVYDLNPVLAPDYFARQALLRRFAARRLMRSALARCRLALTISHATTRSLEQQFPEARGKTRTVWLGVSEDFGSLPAELGAWPPATPDPWRARPYVLYVGVDRPHKNLDRLVRAFARFRAMEGWSPGVGAYLWLAGVGAGSAEVRARITDCALGADVRLSDALEERALSLAYREARVVAYVSLFEGFGLPLLEAFAAGAPVLAANATALPEVAGDAALLVPPHDEAAIAAALGRLWHDDALRLTLVERGRRRARNFSWEATAQGTVEAYRDALRGGRPDPPAGVGFGREAHREGDASAMATP